MMPTNMRSSDSVRGLSRVGGNSKRAAKKVTRMVRHAVFTTVTTRDTFNQPIRERVSIGGRSKVVTSEVVWNVDVAGHDSIEVHATVGVHDGNLTIKIQLPDWAKKCVELT